VHGIFLSLLESARESLGEEIGGLTDEVFMDDELLAFGSNVYCYELVANSSATVSSGIIAKEELLTLQETLVEPSLPR
jgi:hypothetical protein